MEEEFRYRGRIITAAEVEFIRQLIAEHPHTGGAALQLPGRPVSSPWLRAAGGGTSQISGLGGGPGDSLPGLVVGPAASGRARSFYRLVGRGAAPQYPFSRL